MCGEQENSNLAWPNHTEDSETHVFPVYSRFFLRRISNVAGKRMGCKRMVTSQVSASPWDSSHVWVLNFVREIIQEQVIVK